MQHTSQASKTLEDFITLTIPNLETITDIYSKKLSKQWVIVFKDCTPLLEISQINSRLQSYTTLTKPLTISLQVSFSHKFIKYNETFLRMKTYPISSRY